MICVNMKYGFLFGAGAEIAYKLPSGGRFALDLFTQDTSKSKELFKEMRSDVDPSTAYASQWLPKDYLSKQIHVFGKAVFQNIIMSTVEHRRGQIVKNVNDLDEIAERIVSKMKSNSLDVDGAFKTLLGREVANIQLDQVIAYNDAFKNGNKLFESNYFSALLMLYRDKTEESGRTTLGRTLLSIMQLQLGALSEDLSRSINENLFSKKDEKIDLLDDFGELIKLNYNAAGVLGLEFLLEKPEINTSTPYGVILRFAQLLTEDIYASVLDYKSLIDTNWHYLYNPSADWAKFCKISIFLLTVHNYITELGDKADKSIADGYYNMLRKTLNEGKYEATAIATTNYNKIIEEILGSEYPITYLNGSVTVWYDPYLNKVGSKTDLNRSEPHIIVPLLFTQSGTKPMTSISMSMKYVQMYEKWKESDAIVVVGFGFGNDDEHINGILRTLVNDDKKQLKVVTLKHDKTPQLESKEIAKKLKVPDYNRIEVILVDGNGKVDGLPWTECL